MSPTIGRIASALALAAGLGVPSTAFAGESDAGKSETERKLEEVLAELEAQRAEIRALKEQVAGGAVPAGNLAAAVDAYLESKEAEKAQDPLAFQARWKDGLAFENADRSFTLHVGGRLQYDMAFPDADEAVETAVGDYDAMGGFRRLRFETDGTIFGNVDFAVGIEFADAAYAWRNNYFGLRNLPVVGNVRVGFLKEPMSLEELTNDLFTSFSERSLANALVPSYGHGVMLFDAYEDGRICWWAGDFWEPNTPGPAKIQHNLTVRVTGVPFLDAEERRLLHVGLSFSDRSPDSETDRFRSRPEAPFVPFLVDTGTFGVEDETLLGLEAAYVHGPWSVQGEYLRASCSDHPDAPGASPGFHGWYLQGTYFLTGESRPYRNGSFGRPRPKGNFDGKGGSGAFEVALRYSVIDLDDDGIAGGVADDWTLGFNWYLNPNAKVQANYVRANLHHVGDVNSLVLRFQVDF